jgi:hypothetical protein
MGFAAYLEAWQGALADWAQRRRESEILETFALAAREEADRGFSQRPLRAAAEHTARVHDTTPEEVLRLAERGRP